MPLSRLLLWLSAGAIIATAVSCGPVFTSDSADKGNTLCGVGGDFKGFDPVDAGDVESAAQVSRVYEGLLEYAYLDRPYHPVPRLAEAMPDISADGLTYTFKIKPGVHFIDDPCFPDGKGREVVADDFVYSFKRVLNPRLESEGDWIFAGHVLGADDWVKQMSSTNASTDYSAPIPGFRAVDRYTLRIQLARPYPQLLYVLTMCYAFVLPHEAVDFYGDQFRRHPVGTGPFRLKSWRQNYRIEFERNPTFSGQTYPDTGTPDDRAAGLLADAGKPLPLVDRIVEYDIREYYTGWQMFLAGRIFSSGINKDYFERAITPDLSLSPELVKRGIRLYKTPELATDYIGFNMLDPVIGASSDPALNERHRKLRQAFATAIDVNTFVAVIFNNRYTPANTPIPPGVAGHTDQPYPYEYNLERAKRLIAEAGYPGGHDAQDNPLRLTMIVPGSGSTDARQMSDFFEGALRAIGVDLVVQQLSFAEYIRREHDGETQVFWAGWVIDYPDAQNFLQLFYGPNKCPGINASNYQNPEFDHLYERILTMSDSPDRTALYEKMADMTMADCVWALVAYPLNYGLFQPWFQNYKPHAFPYPNAKFYRVLPH
ncbi:MAG TPA: ABC transporter substrate-binding protein [Verrucomicrobiae bacterium]|nr:ABC transporter substrate-binding protein [Verrucomicrobiae bacterium]